MHKIVVKNNVDKKVSPTLKKDIEKALDKLKYLILEKEMHGEHFEKIFNNPTIKYDVFPKNFYTFKYHCHDSAQLRLLYRFVRADNGHVTIELHNFYLKKQNNKQYIKTFDSFVRKFPT